MVATKPNSKLEDIVNFLCRLRQIFFLEPIAVLLGIFTTILMPTLTFLFIPIYIFRYIVSKNYKRFRPDLEGLLHSAQSAFAAFGNFYNRPMNTIVATLKVKGTPDLEEARKIVSEKLINARLPNGEIKYPELKKYPYSWMGFLFWKPDLEFSICNHVNYYSDPSVPQNKIYSDTEAAAVEIELKAKNFHKNRSLWEIVILPNVLPTDPSDTETYSVVYLAIHHCYTDGYGITKLIVEDLGGANLKELLPQPRSRPAQTNCCQKILKYIYTYLFCFYEFFRPCVVGNVLNPWGKVFLKDTYVSSKTQQISLEYLKEVRRKHNVSLASVINTIWLGALRRSAVAKTGTCPYATTVSSPVSMPNHPDHFNIHASVLNFSFRVSLKDPVKRLKEVDDYLQKQRKSPAIAAVLGLKPVFGKIFPSLIKFMYPSIPTSAVFNIFPGPNKSCWIFGHEITEVHFSFGHISGNFSTFLSTVTYKDIVSVKTAINTAIMKTSDEIDEFNSFMMDELEVLAKSEKEVEESKV